MSTGEWREALWTEIIGARKGTEAEKLFCDVAPYVGRLQRDFVSSVNANIWPVGTLARRGGVWYEIMPGPKQHKYNRTYRRIDPPDPSEIMRRSQ